MESEALRASDIRKLSRLTSVFKERDCPACGAKDKKLLFKRNSSDYSKCRCGMIYTVRVLSPVQLSKFYSRGIYQSTIWHERILNPENMAFKEKYMGWCAKHIFRFSPVPHGKILDVGCGLGILLNIMKTRKWRITGVEINTEARKYCLKTLGVMPVYSTKKLHSGDFDVVSMIQYLEHTVNPKDELREAKRLLNKGGLFLLHYLT